MKKTLTKVLLMLLAVAMMASILGCAEKENAFPEYEDDREMLIGGWDSPMNTLEDIQMAKDMGLTHMFLDQRYAKRGTEAFEEALRLYEQVGLNAILQTSNAFKNEQPINDETDYRNFPAVTHINYWDEPYYSTIDRIGELMEEHMATYGTEITFFANLFPNSATSTFENHTYKEYVQKYAETVLEKLPVGYRILSIDLYPLEEKNGQPYVRSNWLGCIETAALQARESEAIVHFFIQCTKHYNYRAVKEEDIRYQFYVNMAFGVQAFSYFTYTDSFLDDFDHSCVDRMESAKPHDTYYMAQQVNSEIKKFDHVYLNYTWKGTLPIIGKNNEEGYNLNFDGLTASLETLDVANRYDATEDALIGAFEDENGNQGLMVVNFTDPALRLDNLVRFDFKEVSKVRVYRKGVAYDYEVLNNRFDLELEPGEGVFIILVK